LQLRRLEKELDAGMQHEAGSLAAPRITALPRAQENNGALEDLGETHWPYLAI
jgi:hypothetical protein